jgi:hypothetical protein
MKGMAFRNPTKLTELSAAQILGPSKTGEFERACHFALSSVEEFVSGQPES